MSSERDPSADYSGSQIELSHDVDDVRVLSPCFPTPSSAQVRRSRECACGRKWGCPSRRHPLAKTSSTPTAIPSSLVFIAKTFKAPRSAETVKTLWRLTSGDGVTSSKEGR